LSWGRNDSARDGASRGSAYTNRWTAGRVVRLATYDVRMISTTETAALPKPCGSAHMARAQSEIRRLTTRSHLTAAERLELARWQRAWVEAWKAAQGVWYVIAA
jgi:hypothetical protein